MWTFSKLGHSHNVQEEHFSKPKIIELHCNLKFLLSYIKLNYL